MMNIFQDEASAAKRREMLARRYPNVKLRVLHRVFGELGHRYIVVREKVTSRGIRFIAVP